MKRKIFFCLIFFPAFFLQGQNVRTIRIDAANARPLNLSQIAETVTPVVLESPPERISNICLTNEYIFITSMSSVVQFDLSGKFAKSIDCGGIVSANVTVDTVKRELYVPVGDKIQRYNYAGNLVREYSLNVTNIASCLFHNDTLWVISWVVQPDKSAIYTTLKINPSTNQLTTLPFEKKNMPLQAPSGGFVQIGLICLLTIYNEDVVVSFSNDPVVYGIQQDKVIPLVQWNINPQAKEVAEQIPLRANGFTGEYLFINFFRDSRYYVYMENMQTGAKYTANNIIDDIFHSSGDCIVKFVGKNGYFAFHKDRDAFTGNSVGGIPLKTGPVVFIVKTK